MVRENRRAGPDRRGDGSSGEALPSPDSHVEAIRGWREGARPFRVERARRLKGKVEVEDERPCLAIAAEVRALRRVEEVAAGAVRLRAVRGVAEREEQTARVALHPVHLESPWTVDEGDRDLPEAAKGHHA